MQNQNSDFINSQYNKEQGTQPQKPTQVTARGIKMRSRISPKSGKEYQTISVHVDKFTEWLEDNQTDGFVNFLIGWKDKDQVHPLILSNYKKPTQG